MDVLEKNAFEKLWAHRNVPDEHKAGWQKLNCIERIWVKAGDVLVMWTWDGESPVVEKLLEIEDFDLDLSTGLAICARSPGFPGTTKITHQPQPIPGTSVYMWVPYFSTVNWTPKFFKEANAPKELTLGLCIRTQSNKAREIRKGQHYVTTLAKFKTEWPNLQG